MQEAEKIKQKCCSLESQVLNQDVVTESLKLQLRVSEEKLSTAEAEKKKTEQVLQELKHREQAAKQVKQKCCTFESQVVKQHSVMESLKRRLCVAEEELSNAAKHIRTHTHTQKSVLVSLIDVTVHNRMNVVCYFL